YRQWAKDNNFKSMIPADVRAHKDAQEAAAANQTTIDDHAVPLPPKECIVPYSDELFEKAVIEWLVATDQPLAAFEHPKFHEMIAVAAQATNGVKIPHRKAACSAIISMFKKNLLEL
ncbi:hypothetical protein GYMLUDRAFT_171993, partial [Collybiopsis luxurians FD-317 M1]